MLLALATGKKGRPGGILEDLTDTLARLGGAFKIVLGTNLLCDCHALFRGDGSLARLSKLLNYAGVTPEIFLATDENDREAGTEMHNFGNPLFLDVIERVRRVDSEAYEDNVRVWVTERSQTVIVLLAGGIP